MRGKTIKKLVASFMCGTLAMLSLSGCGEIEVSMSKGVSNGKATTNGVIKYQDAYYIVDKNGINYLSSLEKDSVIIAYSSIANGTVQDNFAIGDEKIYFVTNATEKGLGKTLYQCNLDGKKRKKLIVRDDINIVGVFNNAVYFYDEQDFLKCIDASTGLKTEISNAYGAPFYQYNNCYVHKANDGLLEVYNCGDRDTHLLSESTISLFNTTSTGVTYAVNTSETKGSYEYEFSTFKYNDMTITPMNKLSTNKPVDVVTETVALTNLKDRLSVCDIESGKVTDYNYKKQGKILYDLAVSPNAYYINDNTCLKFTPDSAEAKKLTANYKKNDIDYNSIKAIIDDSYVVSIDSTGRYSLDKLS